MTTPPGSVETLHARRVLVFAPHYDDEVLGCGGLLLQLLAGGAQVRVVFLTDGGGDPPEGISKEDYVSRRREEARAAAVVLGVEELDELHLPDGGLEQHLDDLTEALRRELLDLRPDLLIVTSPLEASADHRAAFRAVHRILGVVREGDDLAAIAADLDVLACEINQPLYPNLLIDVSAQTEQIEQAMACYPSQQERHDYLGARLGLLRFRALTLPPEVRAVEAYRRFAASELAAVGPSRLISEMGGSPALLKVEEGPLVSVIVRTKDRPELLAEALASLAESTWRRTEVIVVCDGGEKPELPSDYPLEIRLEHLIENQGRSAAANVGVAAAQGDYVAFLDDDDLVEPEHLAVLVGMVRSAGVRVAYTDAAVGVYQLGGAGWARSERRLPYSRDFDPELLLFDNYIPFHTLLIERDLFREAALKDGQPFDVDLPFFEDWDFLQRLAALVPFRHLAQVTCEYRQFRGAGHHVLGDGARERDDFLKRKAEVLRRHASRHGSEITARVIDMLRAERVAESEEVSRLRKELREARSSYHQANGELVESQSYSKTLEESRRVADLATTQERAVLDEALRRERDEHQKLDREIGRLFERERELEERLAREIETRDVELMHLKALVKAMQSTRAWRLHAWWQERKA